ncbi:MAG: twin-arginine translocase TatA/TatE family subunit [Trueperaceae bacterium]|nr:MAG: twin-arginine translocase TatA/TatE family subunit [Trueperaceae bacterium]
MRIGPFGVWEILIILIVVLLIFGPRRLPEMAKGLGQSVREFRKEMRNIKDDFNVDEDRDTPGPRSGVSPATVQEAQEARAPASAVPSAPAADTAVAAESPKADDEKKG